MPGKRIERLYAWVATKADGSEEIITAEFPETRGMKFPLVSTDRAEMDLYLQVVRLMTAVTGNSVALVEFCGRLNHAPVKYG